MIAVILDGRIFHLEVVRGALILVGNLGTGGKIVIRLVRIEGHAQRDIRIVLVTALRKFHAGNARHELCGTARRRAGDDHIVAALVTGAVRNRRGALVGIIGIGIPLTSGKSIVVAVFQIIDVVGCPCGLHKARRTRDRTARYRSRATTSRIALRQVRKNIRVHPGTAIGVVPGAPAKIRGALVLVRHRPVGTRKLVFLHPVKPGRGIAAHGAIAIGIHRTPFRDEHGKPAVHGTDGVRAFVAGRMRTCIKVECVGDVLLGIAHLVPDGIARVLVPATVAHDNQVVGILANRLDNGIGIVLDRAPALRGRLVENFKNHVVVLAPLLRHVAKELLGVVEVVARLVAVVVDNHIDIVVDSRLHYGVHQALVVAFLGKVVA